MLFAALTGVLEVFKDANACPSCGFDTRMTLKEEKDAPDQFARNGFLPLTAGICPPDRVQS